MGNVLRWQKDHLEPTAPGPPNHPRCVRKVKPIYLTG